MDLGLCDTKMIIALLDRNSHHRQSMIPITNNTAFTMPQQIKKIQKTPKAELNHCPNIAEII